MTKEFKVGDEVKVVSVEFYQAPERTVGLQGKVTRVDPEDGGLTVTFGEPENTWWYYRSNELEHVALTMTPKEALHKVIDGATVVNDAGTKMYMEDNVTYIEINNCCKRELNVYLHNYPDSQWKIYEPPMPPKFQPKDIITNADGDIGIVMEPMVVKGNRRTYKVKFKATEDCPLKTYEEAGLAKVEL